MSDLYSIAQAAKLLGVKKSALRKRVARGQVVTEKVGDLIHLITRDELIRLGAKL